MAQFASDHRPLSPGNAGVRHEDIKPIVELLDLRDDGLVDSLRIPDINFICLA